VVNDQTRQHEPRHLAALDLVRGVAIILVVLVHAEQMVHLPPPYASWASLGRYGVPLFFILSGYLMGYLHHEGTTWSVRDFARRRVGRLLPAWWFFLAFWLLAFALSPESPFSLIGMDSGTYTLWFWLGIALSVVLLNDMTPLTANVFVPGGWSISAESIHYVIFARLRRWRTTTIFALASVLTLTTSGFWIAHSLGGPGWTPTAAWLTTWAPWATIPLFLVGLVASRVMPREVTGRSRLLALAIGLPALTLSGFAAFETGLDLLPLVLIAGAAFFFMLATAQRVPRPITTLGAVSYEMYFTQFVVLAALERTTVVGWFAFGSGAFLMFFPLVLLLSYVSALIVRRIVSRPGRRLVNRIWTT